MDNNYETKPCLAAGASTEESAGNVAQTDTNYRTFALADASPGREALKGASIWSIMN